MSLIRLAVPFGSPDFWVGAWFWYGIKFGIDKRFSVSDESAFDPSVVAASKVGGGGSLGVHSMFRTNYLSTIESQVLTRVTD